ncbi:uncharacterized protein LOC120636058 [Pararge aegeria]|uniref:uncharacterized protein LOC120636058 n=1 Tax=Pararge aegeria TaxID=116150 RepID=UPI0019D18384|nr:uncharacterized protein LOC120636058 [Pararge aegeria]
MHPPSKHNPTKLVAARVEIQTYNGTWLHQLRGTNLRIKARVMWGRRKRELPVLVLWTSSIVSEGRHKTPKQPPWLQYTLRSPSALAWLSQSRYGKLVLELGGFRFWIGGKRNSNGWIRWVCKHRRCRANIYTLDNKVIAYKRNHNH